MGESKRRKARAQLNEASAEAAFIALEIDISRPGFYDHPAFQAQEQSDAAFLERYGQFVRDRSFTPEYVERARRVVPAIAEKLQAEMAKANRQRACMDGAISLSKMLEEAGIWNAVMRGAFSAEIDGLEATRRYFHAFGPLDEGAAVHGHTWLFAPPFDVVDVAAKLQPWGVSTLSTSIPEVVLAEGRGGVVPTEELLFDHDLLVAAARDGRRITMNAHLPVQVRSFMREFPGTCMKQGNVKLVYLPTAMTAPDCPFGEVGTGPGGLPAQSLWTDTIRPAVEDLL